MNNQETDANAFLPETWGFVLALSTALYIWNASVSAKILKKAGKTTEAKSVMAFQTMGAISIALWLWAFAYNKYNKWWKTSGVEYMVGWLILSLIPLFTSMYIGNKAH
jgi:hypothetical protein